MRIACLGGGPAGLYFAIAMKRRDPAHEIVVIGHTGCGLLGADEDAMRDRMNAETGDTLEMSFGSFDDLEASVRSSVERLQTHAWLKRVPVHGLVFDVETGRLSPVAS